MRLLLARLLVALASMAACDLLLRAAQATGLLQPPRRPAEVVALIEQSPTHRPTSAGLAMDLPANLPAVRRRVVHPYLGFVAEPRPGAARWDGFRIPPDPPGEGTVVAVFGGSVAGQIADAAETELEPELRRRGWSGRGPVRIVSRSMGGFKQPQALLTLAYFLALGERYDYVLVIDGFNEVVLPPRENVPAGVAAWYPRSWQYLVQTMSDPAVQVRLGRLAVARDRRLAWARLALAPIARLSAIANLVWSVGDRRLEAAIVDGELALQAHRPDDASFAATGAAQAYRSDDEMYAHLVRIWADSSRAMARLATGSSMRYLHFLQPNQYLAGSKPLTAEERSLAVSDRSPFRQGVELGYPRLRSAAAELSREGAPCTDLTMLFAATEEPVYSDDCCHFNARGLSRLLGAIAEEMAAGSPEPASPQR